MSENASTVSAEKIKKLESYRWVVYGILILCYFFVFFHRMAAGVIKGDLIQAFNIGPSEFATLASCYFYTYTIMQIPAGILGDTLGAKKTVSAGMLVAAVGSLIFGFAPNIIVAYIGRAIVGAGVAVVFVPILVIQTRWFYPRNFATLTGLTGGFGNMGAMFAQTPLLMLVAAIGWRYSFIAVGAITLLLFFLVLIFVKSSPQDMGLPSIAEIEGTENVSKGEKLSVGASLISISRNPWTWIPTLIAAVATGAYLTFSGSWGIDLNIAKFGIDKVAGANGNLVLLATVAVVGPFVGGISDKLKNRKWMTVVLLSAYTLAWFLLLFVQIPRVLYYPFMMLMGFGSCIVIMTWTLAKEYNDPRVAGMSTSVVNTFGFACGAIFPMIVGKAMSAYGKNPSFADYRAAFVWLPFALLVVTVLSFFAKETQARNIYQKRD